MLNQRILCINLYYICVFAWFSCKPSPTTEATTMKIWSCSALCSILWPSLGIQYTAYTINRGQHACTLKKNKLKVHWVFSNVLFHGLSSCEELDQSIGDLTIKQVLWTCQLGLGTGNLQNTHKLSNRKTTVLKLCQFYHRIIKCNTTIL